MNDLRYEQATVTITDGELCDVRCHYCHKLLFKGNLAGGSVIEMKCPRGYCNSVNRIVALQG
jgi:phage FluMu protein Com